MASSLNLNCVENGFKCVWKIEKFVRCKPSASFRLVSQTFKVKMLQNSEWHLEIEGRLIKKIGIFLYRDEKGDTRSNDVHFSVSVLTCSGWLAILSDACEKFKSGGDGFGIKDFIDYDKTLISQKHLSLTKALTVCFHMWNGSTSSMSAQCVMKSRMVSDNKIEHLSLQKFSSLKHRVFTNRLVLNVPQLDDAHCSTKENAKTQSTQMNITEDNNLFDLEDLLRLFKEKQFCDVTLRTANKEFPSLKALLCARSPVFNAMFDMSVKEKGSNIIDIDDIDSDTLSSMLQFLHFEPLEDLKWETAVKLYGAAGKYQIEQLKSKCLSILKKELSEENVCEAFVLADVHQDVDLMGSALEFFCNNLKIILRSLKWKSLILERTELASAILREWSERM